MGSAAGLSNKLLLSSRSFRGTRHGLQLSAKPPGTRLYSVIGSGAELGSFLRRTGTRGRNNYVNCFAGIKSGTSASLVFGGSQRLKFLSDGGRKCYCVRATSSPVSSSSPKGMEEEAMRRRDSQNPNLGEEETREEVETSEKEDPNPNDEEYKEFTATPFENEHFVKLTPIQRAIITVGSGLSAFLDPTRAENIATFGEISAGPVLKRLHQKMLEDPEASRILSQKPRINSSTVDLDYLASLPEGTLGQAYIQFLRKNNVTPDSRLPVRFIEDPELAYVMQRYREVHDLVHTVTGQPTNMLGEVVVKWIEGIQTGLPMCVTGGLFGATRLRPKQRQRYKDTHLKWAIDVGFTSRPFLFIFYEERWEQRLTELRFQICPKLLAPPPDKIIKKAKYKL